MGIRGGLPMQPSEWKNSCHRIGTCALTGSAALFASIPGSYVIVNGPLWCYFYAMKYIDDSMPGAAERFYCTQPDQNSVASIQTAIAAVKAGETFSDSEIAQ